MANALSNDVGRRWADALAGGDWSELAVLSSPEMRVWHSHDNLWLTMAESSSRIAEVAAEPPKFHDVRSMPTAEGFVIQACLEPPGEARRHIVQVCAVSDGRVVTCEEYIAPEGPGLSPE